jgi:hypothetical protein
MIQHFSFQEAHRKHEQADQYLLFAERAWVERIHHLLASISASGSKRKALNRR